jgi:hypothetical protein
MAEIVNRVRAGRPRDLALISGRGKKFLLLRKVKTGFGAHPVGTGCSMLGDKAAEAYSCTFASI